MGVLKIIDKKRLGQELDKAEMREFFMGYNDGNVEDYQMSAMLMAITINGMSFQETLTLTDLMLSSGKKMDTRSVKGVLVDKHSTGGVGDKTSLILGPMMAALGLKMGKLSGRGLGITGGTIDKLESIPGFKFHLSSEEFIKYLNTVGFVECEQTDEFTPLDKKMYALRSVTGTVSSIPLIASSIMSKKLACGADYILIDLKVGRGALIKTKKDGVLLANTMIDIGKAYNKTVIPILTNMDRPLGDNVGNALEVLEAMDVLKGKRGTLRDLVIELGSVLYSKCMSLNIDKATKEVTRVLDDGSAYKKFNEFVSMQGGDIDKLDLAPNLVAVESKTEGYLKDIKAEVIGMLSLELGAGRKKKDERIDYGVGVVINKHIGDYIKEGDILCYLYEREVKDYSKLALEAFTIVK